MYFVVFEQRRPTHGVLRDDQAISTEWVDFSPSFLALLPKNFVGNNGCRVYDKSDLAAAQISVMRTPLSAD